MLSRNKSSADTTFHLNADTGGVGDTGMAAATPAESGSALLTQTGPAAQCASTMTPTRVTASMLMTAPTIEPRQLWPRHLSDRI